MDENDILKPEIVDKGAHIIITQAICVAIIILTVVVTKYFFKGCYEDIKNWYQEHVSVQTSVSEVIEFLDGGTDEV